METGDEDVPNAFICPISQCVMDNPVFAADGFSYEGDEIAQWLVGNNTSPLTNAILPHTNLTPNHVLRTQIIEWREKQTVSISSDRVVVDDTEAGIIGRGAWGIVHKGTLIDGKKHIPVAIKMIEAASPEKVLRGLESEIKILKQASSRGLHTAKIYGTTIKDGRLCIVMKLYKQSLAKVISTAPDGKLAPHIALIYTIALFRALAELHSMGILHRDIKPDNILIDEFGNLVIADFGISLSFQTIGCVQTSLIGTWNYMCPELYKTGVPIDFKVDVWAGACCMLQMLTGIEPFKGLQMMQIMMKVCVERELPPEVSSLDIHPNWQAIIKQCMQFEPQNRPTAEAVLTQLTQNSGLSGNDVAAKVKTTLYSTRAELTRK